MGELPSVSDTEIEVGEEEAPALGSLRLRRDCCCLLGTLTGLAGPNTLMHRACAPPWHERRNTATRVAAIIYLLGNTKTHRHRTQQHTARREHPIWYLREEGSSIKFRKMMVRISKFSVDGLL